MVDTDLTALRPVSLQDFTAYALFSGTFFPFLAFFSGIEEWSNDSD